MYHFDRKRFARALRDFRRERSYPDMAQLTGVDPTTLARFEHGVRVDNEAAFRAICRSMGCRPEDFPEPDVKVPRISESLTHEHWAALIRLYRYRQDAYIRESAIGSHEIVQTLGRFGLLEIVNMNLRRLPYVRISDAGLLFYEANEHTYRKRYPDLYQTSELHSAVV